MGSSAFPLFQPAAAPGGSGGSGAGNNQYGNYATGMPGIVPQSNTPGFGFNWSNADNSPTSGVTKQGGSGVSTIMPIFPKMSTDFSNFLMQQIGKGAQPFNMTSFLPSTGGATSPGQLNAPLTPMLQQLESFYSGDPATPVWQNMLAAEKRNTDMNAANLREQFAFAGDLKGTPFATSMTDFYNQNALNQNAQLGQMQLQMAQGKAQLGQFLQGVDQQSIQNTLQEFIRTRPEYSPYLNMLYGMATTFPPSVQTGQGKGVLGGLLSNAGAIASTVIGAL